MSYCLPEGYVERLGAVQQIDRLRDEWQDAVYQTAREYWDAYSLHSVCDVGCGSGFKLQKYFGSEHRTSVIGIDLPDTVAKLQKIYPDRLWSTPDRLPSYYGVDLVICADVIEHVDDPDALLAKLKSMRPRWLVISTPDRDLLKTPMGPPSNPQHVREWGFQEFENYMRPHCWSMRHFHSNKAQATQCIVARFSE